MQQQQCRDVAALSPKIKFMKIYEMAFQKTLDGRSSGTAIKHMLELESQI